MIVEEFLGLELLLAVGALKVANPLVEILREREQKNQKNPTCTHITQHTVR
jgi:hypothetical protein